MTEEDALVSAVSAAFPAQRPFSREQLVHTTDDEEYALTAKAFADKEDWTELDGKWLNQAPDGLASAPSFLSDEALCFYVPAYILADVKGELENVDPVFDLTHGFTVSSVTTRTHCGHRDQR